MKKQTSDTPLARAHLKYEDKIKGRFKPDARFYQSVGINRRRYGQLLRGEKTMLATEITALANFFEIPVTQFVGNKR